MSSEVERMKASKCPCCGASGAQVYGSKGRVRLLVCPRCAFGFADRSLWTDPYLDEDYYDADAHGDVVYPLTPSATDFDRVATITRSTAGGRYLDYGGGLGTTALAALARGFQPTVLEDSTRAVCEGERFHPEIQWIQSCGIPPTIPNAIFDAASLFHVLEHIVEPQILLSDIHRVLKPSGILVIEVPNWGSNVRRLQRMHWQYVLDHHVNYFDRRTLKRMVEPVGFTLVCTEFRRSFCVNEDQAWKEPLKRILCGLGFGEILRCSFERCE